jgi:hypothetical protein
VHSPELCHFKRFLSLKFHCLHHVIFLFIEIISYPCSLSYFWNHFFTRNLAQITPRKCLMSIYVRGEPSYLVFYIDVDVKCETYGVINFFLELGYGVINYCPCKKMLRTWEVIHWFYIICMLLCVGRRQICIVRLCFLRAIFC